MIPLQTEGHTTNERSICAGLLPLTTFTAEAGADFTAEATCPCPWPVRFTRIPLANCSPSHIPGWSPEFVPPDAPAGNLRRKDPITLNVLVHGPYQPSEAARGQLQGGFSEEVLLHAVSPHQRPKQGIRLRRMTFREP